MTIEEVKVHKRECEQAIRQAILDFQTKTNLTVNDLETDQIRTAKGLEIFNVKVIVKV